MDKRRSVVQRLVTQGVYWLVVSTVLDYATAWIMMWFRGPALEGNTALRLFFEHPGFASFFAKLLQEYAWFGLAAVGIICVLIIKSERLARASSKWQKAVFVAGLEAGFVIWLFAALRLALGPASNIFGILHYYGELAGLAGALLFFIITLVAMIRGLKRRNRAVDRFFCSSPGTDVQQDSRDH